MTARTLGDDGNTPSRFVIVMAGTFSWATGLLWIAIAAFFIYTAATWTPLYSARAQALWHAVLWTCFLSLVMTAAVAWQLLTSNYRQQYRKALLISLLAMVGIGLLAVPFFLAALVPRAG